MKIAIENKGIILKLSWEEAENLKSDLGNYLDIYEYNHESTKNIHHELDEIFTKEGH